MMERKDVIRKLTEVFCDVLDLDEMELTDATTRADIEEWDSFSHVHLVMEIQKEFCMTFPPSEALSWKTVDGIVDSIMSRSV